MPSTLMNIIYVMPKSGALSHACDVVIKFNEELLEAVIKFNEELLEAVYF